jgi:hypothetical protein
MLTKSNTKVVHCQKHPYDVYIGRENRAVGLLQSKWANPFKEGIDGTRDEVVEKYYEWVQKQPDLMESLHELKGKTLGCWCDANQNCHGKALVKLLTFNKYFTT